MLQRLETASPPQTRDDPPVSYGVLSLLSSACESDVLPDSDPRLTSLVENVEWMKAGNCHPTNRPAHVPAQAWYATARRIEVDGIMMRGFKLARSALELCAECPVQHDCFDYAIAIDIEDGIWGVEEADLRRWKKYRADVRRTMVERARHTSTPIQQAAKGTP